MSGLSVISMRRTRSRLIGAAVLSATLAASAACSSSGPSSSSGGGGGGGGGGGKTTVVEQLGWLGDYEQAGEAVAIAKGWYAQNGINLKIQQGGPSNDGVNIVASGRALVGQTSSSPAIMLARSQGEPVTAIAAGLQKHPFAYISLPGKAVNTPQELVGKSVGTQATAQILLHALEAKNNIQQSKVNVKVIGSDVTPLTTHQVDVWTGWLTDQASLSKIGGKYIAMPLWNTGIHLYALVYYTSDQMLKNKPKLLASYLAATARGWQYAAQHPDEAVTDVMKLYSGLNRSEQIASLKVLTSEFMGSADTAAHGWGAMDSAVWQQQITMWNQLGQFHNGAPALDKVMTTSVLDATAGQRPKISSSGG